MRDWWTAEDNQRFNAEAKVFGDQYAKFEAVPGMFVNPALTMGENIADFAGISVALDAYHRSLGGKPAPVIDGLTGDQRFFLAFAQVWREKQRDDALKQPGDDRPAQPRPVPGARADPQRPGMVRRVRHHAGQSDVHPAGETRAHLVG